MNAGEAIFRGVLDLSWRASWLVVAVLALRALLRGRLPARVIFWMWIAVAIRLLLPVSFHASWSPFNLPGFAHRSEAEIAREANAGFSQAFAADRPSLTNSKAIAPSEPRVSRWKKLTPMQWAAAIWFAGVVVLLFARGWACVRFGRKLHRSRSAAASATALGFAPLAIEVIETDAVSAPALHGIFRPRLLLPRQFAEKLTPVELRLVVAHELAHEERRDLLAQVLIRTAIVVHWFNPLAWIAARIARDDCELACDEFVLRRLTATQRETYGATLLKIIALANCGTPPPLGLGVVESKQQIKRRIQMIVDQPSPTPARTVIGCALFLLVTGLSLTREIRAQPAPAISEPRVTAPVRTIAPADTSPPKFKYDPATDGLGTIFPNGVVATVADKVITVEDVRRELTPLVPQLQRDARDQDEFNLKIRRLQNSVIKDLIGRILLIKEFNQHKDTVGEKHIPAEYVDNAIADRLKDQFDNDRAKFLAYLRDRGVTLRDYRQEVEEEIIYRYMRGQERNLDKDANAQRAKPGPQVHLRMIQLKRAADETDAALLARADVILGRFKHGEAFAALAREFDEDLRRDKGGDWGWQSAADLKTEYSEKVFAMKVGEVSAPMVGKEGCFLLFVEGRK